MDASFPHWQLAEGRPRRSGAWSTTSSWISVAVWRSSTAQPSRGGGGPRGPAPRARGRGRGGGGRVPAGPRDVAAHLADQGDGRVERAGDLVLDGAELRAHELADALLQQGFQGGCGAQRRDYRAMARSLSLICAPGAIP